MKHSVIKTSPAKHLQKKGQGMTEYIIIVAIVAIAAIAVIGLFGEDIKNSFNRSGQALQGNKDTGASGNAYDTDAVDFGDFDAAGKAGQ